MDKPYHVRLAISQYGDQFRAELFTEDLGDTEGKELFPSINKLPVGNAQDGDPLTFAQWLDSIAAGHVEFDAYQVREIGQLLFTYLLGRGENSEKWQAICTQADKQGRNIRLLIDATTADVYDLPYGLLCAQNGKFLFQPEPDRLAIQFVRILRQSTPRMLQLTRKPLRLLVVAAEPKGLEVGCANYLCQFLQGLGDGYAVTLCDADGASPLSEVITGTPDTWQSAQFTRFCRATKATLKQTLQGGDYDLLHVIAHGVETGLLLCDVAGAQEKVPSGDFGNWCRASRLQLAFLQVCKSGQAGTRGAFGGIAQTLVSPQFGNLAAVVASPYPIDPAQSTQVAIRFYQRLLTEAELHPDLALWRSFPDDEGDWRLWALLELWVRPCALGGTGTRGYFQFPSPYRGLARFEERDAEIFFGRDAEILDLLKIVSQEPVVAVVGDSGSGKSSLLQAGVCARMRRDGPAIGTDWSKPVDPSKRTDWRIVSLTPGEKPAQSLALALGGSPANQPDEAALRQAFAQVRQAAQPLLLVFDQFEELFTLCADPAERLAVSTVLAEEAQQYPDQFRLILGMRSEYLGAAAKLPGLNARISRPWVLKFPDASNVRAIVEQPAHYHGYTFAAGLLEKILTDPLLTTGAAPLPLLEFALERLWLKAVERGSQEFTQTDYEALGGLEGAIARHADDIYDYLPQRPELGPTAQHVAEQILTGLVTTTTSTGTTKHTRRPWPRKELAEETGNPEIAQKVIDRLVGERLLTLRRNPNQPDDALVDLSHEVLLTRWEKLQEWLALDPEGRAMKEAFQKDLDRWDQGLPDTPAKSPQLLPTAEVAVGYLAWIDNSKPTLTETQHIFADELRNLLRRKAEAEAEQRRAKEEQRQKELKAAQDLAEEQQKRAEERARAAQKLRRWLIIAAIAAFIAVIAAVLGWVYQRKAEQQKKEAQLAQAETNVQERRAVKERKKAVQAKTEADRQARIARSRQLAAQSELNQAQGSVELGTLLAVDAMKGLVEIDERIVEVDQVLRKGLELLPAPKAQMKHQTTVNAMAFSSDGIWVATAAEDGMLRLWKTDTGEEIWKVADQDMIHALAFSPDSKFLASASADHTVRVWELTTGREILRGEHAQSVNDVVFSEDGKFLATASDDHTARIWELQTGQEVARFEHQAKVNAVTFGPGYDKKWVATASDDHTARIWDVENGAELARFDHESEVLQVRFNQFNQSLGSQSKSFDEFRIGFNHPGPEQQLVTQSAVNDKYMITIDDMNHTFNDPIPSGSRMTHLWDIETKREVVLEYEEEKGLFQGNFFTLSNAAFSPDREWLATGSVLYGALQAWETKTGRRKTWLEYPDQSLLKTLAFSPDKPWLFTGHSNGTIRIADISANAWISSFAHAGGVNALIFSQDGRWLASGFGDNMVRVWRIGQTVDVAANDVNVSSSVTITQDAIPPQPINLAGKLLTITFEGNTVHITEHDTGRTISQISYQEKWIVIDAITLNFSPERKWLVIYTTASDEKSIQKMVMILETATDDFLEQNCIDCIVRFSPHDEWLAISGVDYEDDYKNIITIVHLPTKSQLLEIPIIYKEKNTDDTLVMGKTIQDIQFSPDNRWVFVISNIETRTVRGGMTYRRDNIVVHKAQIVSEQEVSQMEEVSWIGTELSAVALSSDSTLIAAGKRDGTVSIWETLTQQQIAVIRTDSYIFRLTFSPDSQWLAIAGVNKNEIVQVQVFSVPSGQEVTRIPTNYTNLDLMGDMGNTIKVFFSADNRKLIIDGFKDVMAWLFQPEDLIEEACSRLPRNLAYDEWQRYFPGEPYQKICPGLPVHYSVFEAAQNLAKTGNIDEAQAIFQHVVQLDSSITLDSVTEAKKWRARGLIEEGRGLARNGDTDSAIATFKNALEFDPGLKIDLTAEINRWRAKGLIREGQDLARQGNIDSALAKFKNALEFDPAVKLDLTEIVGGLAWAGNIKGALAVYTETRKLDPRLKIPAEEWNKLCWHGSLHDAAAEVLYACEQAVNGAGDEDKAIYHDSRGLARALTGDFAGAIKDFQIYADETGNPQRKEWIETLQKGENPFTSDVLEQLRNE